MKKLFSVLLAALLCSSAVLTGCKDDVEKTPVNNDEQQVETNNGVVAEEGSDLAYYNSLIEQIDLAVAPQDIDKEVVATINDVPITASSARYAISSALNQAEYYKMFGMEMPEEDVTNYAIESMEMNVALVSLANKLGVNVSEEEYTNNINSIIEEIKATYGDGEDYDKAFEEAKITQNYFYLYNGIYSRLFNELITEASINPESEYYEEIRSLTEDGLLRAKHILVKFPDGEGENGEITEDQKAATLEKANAVLAEVKAMGDISEFDALIEKYNEDPGMESNPDGYFFGEGEMVVEFENATKELEEGKTSELVETSYGYHIILKLPIDEEAKATETYVSTIQGRMQDNAATVINNALTELCESYEMVKAENFDERYADFVKEFEDMLAAAQAEAEAETQAQAEAEVEADVEVEVEAAE